jgi:signal transduction histidine kinase/ligand-binding sensor domain-containing protein
MAPSFRIVMSLLLLVGTVPASAEVPRKAGSPAVQSSLISQFTHRAYLREEGLPQNSVNAIVQTQDGYLWIGTQEGLARFDGNRFTVYNKRTTPALWNNYIWSLMEDRRGGLWAGTNGGGVTKWSASGVVTYTTANGLPGNIVWCTFQDEDSTVWVGTERGLAFGRPDSERRDSAVFHPIPGLESVSVRAIGRAPDGTLWLATSSGPYSYRGGRLSRHRVPDEGPYHSIRRMIIGGRDRLLLGSGRTIFAVESGTPKTFAHIPGRTRTIVFDMQADTAGSLWVATGGEGIWRLSRGTWSSFTTEDGLPDDQVRSLLIDREGSIWAGTYGGGLNALHDAKFTAFTRRSGLENEFILSLSEGRDGSMWLGTYGGGLSRLRGTSVRNYPESPSGMPDVITSILEDRQGRIFLGSPELPLLQFDPSTGRIHHAVVDSPASVGCLFEDRRGRLWMGSPSGAAVLDRGRLTSYNRANSPLTEAVIAIEEGADSSIWFGTQGAGLVRLHRGAFTQFTSADGATDNVIALHADASGTLWIGSDGDGLVKLSDGRFRSYSTSQGLFDDVVFTVLEDHAGYLWMSSNNGIFRVRKDDVALFDRGLLRVIPCQAFGTADGMKSSECNGRRQPSGWIARNGRLWFATLNGAVMVDPTSLRASSPPPPVAIERIQADDREVAAAEGLAFSPGTQRFTFEYTAFSFLAPERTQFRFRLDGYDIDWIDAGPRRSASYTNLPPGEYRFRVIARNSDGGWNENGASVGFSLRPFFYQTRVFLIAALASVMFFAFAVGRLRVRQLQRREAELMDIVGERTRSLMAEKQRVEEALRDAEAARAEAERSREIAEEANTLKSRLLRLVAHDLKSPLISIKGFAQIIREQAARRSAPGEMADMIHGLTVNLVSQINQLLNSEAIESGKMTLVMTTVNVNRLAREVVSANKMFAASKRQTLEFRDTDHDACWVEADEARLRDAFDNLMTNAVKYSPPGKTIRVAVTRAASTVRFSVQDEGPGLTGEDKKNLFRTFQRLSAQPTGGESATGLGLSIANEIVALHNGTILVDSQEGAGSTFTIELPLLR